MAILAKILHYGEEQLRKTEDYLLPARRVLHGALSENSVVESCSHHVQSHVLPWLRGTETVMSHMCKILYYGKSREEANTPKCS